MPSGRRRAGRKQSRADRVLEGLKYLGAALGAVAAIAGAIAAIAALFGSRDDDPVAHRPAGSPVAQFVSASSRVLPLGECLRIANLADPDLPEEARRAPALLVQWRLRLRNYEGHPLPLDWTVEDNRSGRLIAGPETDPVSAERPLDEEERRFCVPLTRDEVDAAVVRIELWRDDDRRKLAASITAKRED